MRQRPAVSSQRSAKAFALLLAVALLAVPLRAQDVNRRFSSLGHKMICGCGCNQILLECNHVGCPLSEGMRNELTAALKRGQSDGQILDAFVEKYGPTILAAPTMSGFNLTAWITPFAVLLAAFASAVLVVRSWKKRPLRALSSAAAPQDTAPYLEEVRRETEL
jgi:cytochrome c-type biogenesis protein CcmH